MLQCCQNMDTVVNAGTAFSRGRGVCHHDFITPKIFLLPYKVDFGSVAPGLLLTGHRRFGWSAPDFSGLWLTGHRGFGLSTPDFYFF